MKKVFLSAPHVLSLIASSGVTRRMHFDLNAGAGLTEEQKRAAALLEVKQTAEKAAQDALPGLLKQNLTTDEVKTVLSSIVNEAFKTAKFTDSVDNTEKTVSEIVTELQKQHDDLAVIVNEFKAKGANSEKGALLEFIEKSITANKITDLNKKPSASYSEDLAFKAAALMTTANVVPNVAGGFSPLFGNYIDAEIGHTPKPAPIFMRLVTVTYQPGTENIYYTDRINEEGTAEFIAEGALKPLIDAEYKTTSLQTKELAERWKMTTRLMYHAPAVVSDFREHANELIEQVLDTAVLTGDNTGNNLNGIVAQASAFVVPPSLAAYYAFANIWDVVMAMATAIRLANYNGKITAVLNTVWMAQMAGIKDQEGRYVIAPFVAPNGKTIGDVEIEFTNKIPAANILVGDLKKYKLVISEDAIYNEGYENDDFSKNLVSKKIETFAQGYIKQSDEGAIIYDTIADVLTDIEKPETT